MSSHLSERECGQESNGLLEALIPPHVQRGVEGWRARADARGAALLLCVPSANDVGPAHHADCDDAELRQIEAGEIEGLNRTRRSPCHAKMRNARMSRKNRHAI
jgi:hypothetical protein